MVKTEPVERRRQRLPRAAKELILRVLAEYGSPTEAVQATKEQFAITVSNSAVCYYLRAEKWREEIERHRQALESNLERLPICSKFWRMRQRQQLFDQATRQEPTDLKTARGLLLDAARELGQLAGEKLDASIPSGDIALIRGLRALSPEAWKEYLTTGRITCLANEVPEARRIK